jgi:hypothetical protein
MEGTPQRRFAVGSDASASSPAAMPAGSRNCGRIQTEISMTISMTPMISAVAPPRVLMEMTRSPRCNVAYVGTRMTKPDPMRNLLAKTAWCGASARTAVPSVRAARTAPAHGTRTGGLGERFEQPGRAI